MLYFDSKSLVNPLLVSICAKLLTGPTVDIPVFINMSAKPLAKGSSGPITTHSTSFVLAKSIIIFFDSLEL